MSHRSVNTPMLARVEGEGGLHIHVENGEVTEVRLEIFEPPRYFESLLVGHRFSEVLDITARICGICPVAYQMTAAQAFEELFGTVVPDGTAELRRLLYCAEWIQSHMLHVHLLAAPDYLGYPDAFAMLKDHREAFDRGLRLRAVGSEIMATIGGRPVHPVSPKVGGFSRVPRPFEVRALLPALERAAQDIVDVADWAARFAIPAMSRPMELVALVHPDEYPLNDGAVATSSGADFAAADFEVYTEGMEVAHSSARHTRMRGRGPAVVGPLARINLNANRLTPLATEVAARLGFDVPTTDPFQSLAARIIETAVAIDESIRLVESYSPPAPASVEVIPRAGRATWATEAPRGVIYHRYDVDGDGIIQAAKLVPPTEHNLANMEDDAARIVAQSLHLSDEELTRLCEMAVRNYDPCISCAAHFLDLRMKEA